MDDPLVLENRERATAAAGLSPEYHRVENCEIEVPRPAALIIFGASGDLTRRKLLPSLYRLYKNRMLAEQFFILGTSRVEMTTEQFRASMQEAIQSAFPLEFDKAVWDKLATRLYYSTFDYEDPEVLYRRPQRTSCRSSRPGTRRAGTAFFIWPSRPRCSKRWSTTSGPRVCSARTRAAAMS